MNLKETASLLGWKREQVEIAIREGVETPQKKLRVGQEVGFILASDSEDNLRQAEFSNVEFGTSVISYFKGPKSGGLKVFVTAVFSGRIRQFGSAVFARDGTLLGIISGVEKIEYDAGRRAVVKTLLGFPKFTKPKLKQAGK
jgi:hypothetical protein